MRFTTIAVLLLAASVAYAQPGNGRGNGRGNGSEYKDAAGEKVREEAKDLKEIAQQLRDNAHGLVKGQKDIDKEQASLRGSNGPKPAEPKPAGPKPAEPMPDEVA